jgi:N-acetylglucosamine kinase-like BadF-type ATPase
MTAKASWPGTNEETAPRPAILAVDGGNSKADVALVAADGTLLAAVHGPSISHQSVGLARGMANLDEIVGRAAVAAGLRAAGTSALAHAAATGERFVAELGVYCLAGADYPSDVRTLRRGIERLALTHAVAILNDTFGALRAGTKRPWGVVLVCGRGINAAAIAPDGRNARFDAIGTLSGDWGGGMGLGEAALAAAVRAADGRGPATILERVVPERFGFRSPPPLTRALYAERVQHERLVELAPVVFEAAEAGDAVARAIVDRLADELVAMAGALLRRLRMQRLDPEVVLAGGVFRATDSDFYERIRSGIAAVAPAARIVRLSAQPVLGAALLGLDRLSPTGVAEGSADSRLRAALEAWRPT